MIESFRFFGLTDDEGVSGLVTSANLDFSAIPLKVAEAYLLLHDAIEHRFDTCIRGIGNELAALGSILYLRYTNKDIRKDIERIVEEIQNQEETLEDCWHLLKDKPIDEEYLEEIDFYLDDISFPDRDIFKSYLTFGYVDAKRRYPDWNQFRYEDWLCNLKQSISGLLDEFDFLSDNVDNLSFTLEVDDTGNAALTWDDEDTYRTEIEEAEEE